jgi:iron complex outermembrane recepter protein
MKLLSRCLQPRLLLIVGLLGMGLVSPVEVEAQDTEVRSQKSEVGANDRSPVQKLAQSSQLTRVTGVEVKETPKGLELILKTVAGGQRLVPLILPEGNDLVIDILDATLAFSIRNGVEELNPAEGINKITVNKVDESSIRVRISGQNQAPNAEVVPGSNLVLSVTPEGATTEQAPDEEIEVIATGEAEEEGYNVPNSNVGTRTDTPLRDVPQSIQIVPQQVLEEQQVDSLNEALKNVPGITPNTPDSTPVFNSFTIRGFFAGEGQNFTRNGLNLRFADSGTATFSNIERVEVLRGPASVLFGRGNPGGTINIVTKQPLKDPFYSVEASAGSYDFYQGALDLTGPLNDSKTISYRLNASYESAESFIDFVDREISAVAGVLKFELSQNTDLTFDLQYVGFTQRNTSGLPVEGTILPNPNGEIPRNRNLADPDGRFIQDRLIVGYNLEHRFSDDWKLRNAFYFADNNYGIRDSNGGISLEPDLRTVERFADEVDTRDQTFDLVTNVVGKFSTGTIDHQLLFGVDLSRFDSKFFTDGAFRGTPIDLFDPVYSTEILERTDPPSETTTLTDSIGIYLQDQVTITNNFKFLLGGRFDAFEQTDEDQIEDTETSQSGDAFSPRVGIVYQPIEPISLYASYARSFTPTIGRSRDNEPFEPGRGTQYEIGVKADINKNFSSTLALYDLTRTNVETTDPENSNFQIQTGEQNSQGVELFISGEILPGWNVIAGYAYTDAKITEDNTFPVGNSINNVAENTFNLWTSYELQQGSLQGLGFGVGFFVVGDRAGDLENTFTLPSYFRTDAGIFYNRDRFKAALNFNNLFDVEYFENSNSGLSVSPAEPFTVQGTVSYEF